MQKKSFFILTVLTTVIAVAVRIWVTLYYTNPITGKFDSPIWQAVNIAALILCALPALAIFFYKYTDYKVCLTYSLPLVRSFSVLAAFSSVTSSIYCIIKHMSTPLERFSLYIAIAGLLSTMFFIYIAIKADKAKKDSVLYLAIGPFLFIILRIIEIFNFYSRNISLYTYQYEIVGMCCILIFFLLFIGAVTQKTSAKTALFFSLTAFSFLFIYSLPQIILPIFGQGYFTNNAPSYYIYSDLLLGICSLYFGTLMVQQKTVKH